MTKDNNLLGKFELTGIPPAPRGVPQVEVTFDINADGILNVNALDKTSGKTEKITITNDKGRLSAEDIEKMVSDAEKFKDEDEKNFKRIEAKNKLEGYLYGVSSSLTDELKSKMEPDDLEKVNTTVDNGKEWLESHQSEECEEYESKMKEYEEVISPIITKLSQGAGAGFSGGAGGMPDFSGGMPGAGGMPGGMPGGMSDFSGGAETVEEVD